MNRIVSFCARPSWVLGMALGLAAALLTGCRSTPNPNPSEPFVFPGTTAAVVSSPGTLAGMGAAERGGNSELRPGENISIAFSDLPPEHSLRPMDIRIGEDGKVTLLYSCTFVAAGKTATELQEEIRAAYVPKFYRQLTVTVTGAQLYYYVGGEVRNPNRFIHFGNMTVLRAIDTAGGFGEYADKTKVSLTRSGGQEFIINSKRAIRKPELDLPVTPNDRIYVPRRPW